MTTSPAASGVEAAVIAVAERARAAANELALATRGQKDAALRAMAAASGACRVGTSVLKSITSAHSAAPRPPAGRATTSRST